MFTSLATSVKIEWLASTSFAPAKNPEGGREPCRAGIPISNWFRVCGAYFGNAERELPSLAVDPGVPSGDWLAVVTRAPDSAA